LEDALTPPPRLREFNTPVALQASEVGVEVIVLRRKRAQRCRPTTKHARKAAQPLARASYRHRRAAVAHLGRYFRRCYVLGTEPKVALHLPHQVYQHIRIPLHTTPSPIL
jgi:hypothetical protein